MVDQAETAEPEQTEPLHSTPSQNADGLKTDTTEELRDKQSPRSLEPEDTEKVMLLKCSLYKQILQILLQYVPRVRIYVVMF